MLVLVWTSVQLVNADVQTLGDRRLFFSGQERQAMAIADNRLRLEGSTPHVTNEVRTDRPASSVSQNSPSSLKSSDRLPDRPSTLVINGFIKASGFLTLIVNGKPCESVPLAVESPRGIDCNHLAELLLPAMSLERVDEYRIVIKISDGNVILLDR